MAALKYRKCYMFSSEAHRDMILVYKLMFSDIRNPMVLIKILCNWQPSWIF